MHAATALLDPVWGGAYQYSVGGHWSEPHFEKLISIQATYIREYSLAYAQTHNPEDLAAAQSVHRYVQDFLSDQPSGVFFVSQDADLHDGEENEAYFKLDDKGRRALGVPRVDRHVYARENGWMIAAFCDLYAVSGDASALTQAQKAAQSIVLHRSLPGGGFRHDDADPAGPYLGDTLAMGRAFLELYNVTADRSYLSAAGRAADLSQRTLHPWHPVPASSRLLLVQMRPILRTLIETRISLWFVLLQSSRLPRLTNGIATWLRRRCVIWRRTQSPCARCPQASCLRQMTSRRVLCTSPFWERRKRHAPRRCMLRHCER